MARMILLAVCLSLACQSRKEPEKIAEDIPVVQSAKLREPPLQSILEWDFGKWGIVRGLFGTRRMDPLQAQRCDVDPYRAMRMTKDLQENGPHRWVMIQVRVNEIGMRHFGLETTMSVGTVVIKEKHGYPGEGEERTDRPYAVAAMIKREPGYDPDHGDWEYAFQVNLPVKDKSLTQGKLATCIGCHETVRDKDYLFRKQNSKQ